MDADQLTYENLFALLASLGFREEPPSDATACEPRIFIHDRTDTVLLFRGRLDEPVRPADVLSAEVHLHANKIVNQPLESLLRASPVNK